MTVNIYKTRQDKTRQDKTRQDKTRQDKTRQDKTRLISSPYYLSLNTFLAYQYTIEK
jgi:hypothetical protein